MTISNIDGHDLTPETLAIAELLTAAQGPYTITVDADGTQHVIPENRALTVTYVGGKATTYHSQSDGEAEERQETS